jgi:hypothetical protein
MLERSITFSKLVDFQGGYSKSMTNLQEFVYRTMEGQHSSGLDTSGAIYPTLGAVADSIIVYQSSRNTKDDLHVCEVRKHIANSCDLFETRLNGELRNNIDQTIREKLQAKINSLKVKDPTDTILIMSAHQPNLFPYSGVTRKVAMMVALSDLIQERLNHSKEVICLFAIADHDFVHNKWVRSAELPAPLRKEGTLRYSIKIPQKDIMLPSNKVPKPSLELLRMWKSQTSSWIKENSDMAQKYARTHQQIESHYASKEYLIIANEYFENFWKNVENAHSSSKTLAEFSAQILSDVIRNSWREPVLFAYFSDCFPYFSREYLWMMDNASRFSEIIQKNEAQLRAEGIDSGLAEDIDEVSPIWLKCSCGSKYRLKFGSSDAVGRCVRCGSDVVYSLPKLKELLSKNPELFEPRSITMPIALARGLDASCYIGGIGGLGYLMHTRAISESFESRLPPTPFWYVDDSFMSVELFCSALQIDRLAKTYSINLQDHKGDDYLNARELEEKASAILEVIQSRLREGSLRKTPVTERDTQLLSNIMTSVRAKGCLLDYVINVGLESTNQQWLAFLRRDGRLHVSVNLRSAFEP